MSDPQPPKSPAELQLSFVVAGQCMIARCSGPSDCSTCIATIYQPIFNHLEDSDCTGLVIDKREIECSREKKSLNLLVDTIMRYKNRSPLRKMALVTDINYTQDETVLRDILFGKGLNIRLFSDLDEAIQWAQSYP